MKFKKRIKGPRLPNLAAVNIPSCPPEVHFNVSARLLEKSPMLLFLFNTEGKWPTEGNCSYTFVKETDIATIQILLKDPKYLISFKVGELDSFAEVIIYSVDGLWPGLLPERLLKASRLLHEQILRTGPELSDMYKCYVLTNGKMISASRTVQRIVYTE